MGGGYHDAPWVFKGRALYQLQLVRAEEARKYIPSEFKLVELFGFTLGGFYLARYEDSPVHAFDELVALAGLVWDPPASCAWAARVYVSNREARDHGLTHVGLPSRLAAFTAVPPAASTTGSSGSSSGSAPSSWWQPHPTAGRQQGALVEVRNSERGGRGLRRPVCALQLPPIPTSGFRGPRLTLSLPSFSGGTLQHPGLLQYACDLATSVMPVAPARVLLGPHPPPGESAGERGGEGGGEVLDLVLGGRPLVALAFSDMEMTVQAPTPLDLSKSRGAKRGAAPEPVPALAAAASWLRR